MKLKKLYFSYYETKSKASLFVNIILLFGSDTKSYTITSCVYVTYTKKGLHNKVCGIPTYKTPEHAETETKHFYI